MLRTGIATSESIAEALENAGTPLTYGATPEAWREALTTISGADEEIKPRETEEVIGWSSTNETILRTINEEDTTKGIYTVDIIFINKDGEPVEVDSVILNGISGVKENDHYEFANIEEELIDVELKYSINGKEYTVTKSYSTFTDDVVIIKGKGKKIESVIEYVVTEDKVYVDNKDYYAKDGETYNKLIVGTDYEISDTITGTVYEIKA